MYVYIVNGRLDSLEDGLSQLDTQAMLHTVSDLAAGADSLLHAMTDTEGMSEAENQANLYAAIDSFENTTANAAGK